MSLSTFVKSLQNIMRNDEGINGDAQRIEQIVWLLFLKIYDAKEEEWEFMDSAYRSIIPEKLRWRSWAVDKKDGKALTGDALLNFVNNELFPGLRDLPLDETSSRRQRIVRAAFEDNNNFMKKGVLLRQVINVIDAIDVSSLNSRHAFGEIYETILKSLQSAGNAGEFYTPRAVTDFMAAMLAPKLGERIADFACGTGKELFAQAIHSASSRAGHPFIPVNCAAIPENLLEGILFGTVKGAYTDAPDKPGLFEKANCGTLLFDELNSMPLGLQAKLLRVIQEKRVRRLGSHTEIPINVRIISILNEHPLRAVDQGLLRRDLFYRLAVVGIAVPPLRKRQNDIPLLVRHIINRSELAMKTAGVTLDDEVMGIFRRYPWPGNIRELAHVIEGSLALLDGSDVITVHNLPRHFREACNLQPADDDLRPPLPNMMRAEPQMPVSAATTPDYFDYRSIRRGDSVSIKTCLHEYESSCIRNVLRVTGGNVAKAARIMELTPAGLHYRMKVLHIENED